MGTNRLRGAIFVVLSACLLPSVGCTVNAFELGGVDQTFHVATAIVAAQATIESIPIALTMTTVPTLTPLVVPSAAPTGTVSSEAPTPATAPSQPTPVNLPTSSPTPTPSPSWEPIYIGDSAGGRPIYAHRLGSGPTPIVLVGGMHGGYEWNTVLLAQEVLEHLQAKRNEVPAEVTLYIIPSANPDGLALVAGDGGDLQPTDVISDTASGRFNANGVDLNRNWDCLWSEEALWRDQPVSAGTHPFSEPESDSLRHFFLDARPVVVVFWHSAAGGVYASGCPEPDPASFESARVYGSAAAYPVYPAFDHYQITGDAGDWLTTQGIASFTVELTTHETLDWEQNLAGVRAILAYLGGGPEQPGRTYPRQ